MINIGCVSSPCTTRSPHRMHSRTSSNQRRSRSPKCMERTRPGSRSYQARMTKLSRFCSFISMPRHGRGLWLEVFSRSEDTRDMRFACLFPALVFSTLLTIHICKSRSPTQLSSLESYYCSEASRLSHSSTIRHSCSSRNMASIRAL